MIFSFSRLNLYSQCKFRFYKKYILKYEEPTTLPLALGKAVHKAIEDKINGADHSEAVLNGLIEADFHEEVTTDEISNLTNRAKLYPDMGDTEIHFKLPLEDKEDAPMIQGFIDVVGKKREFITDWKTNRKRYNVLDNHQVGLYAWAVSKKYNVSNVLGTLFFLRFRKGSSHLFNAWDMENARLWALGIANEINSKLELYDMIPEKAADIFPASPSSICQHCPFVLDCKQTFTNY